MAFDISILLFSGWFLTLSLAEPASDKRALLSFARGLPRGSVLNWHENSSACQNWRGVICSRDRRRVIGVNLPGIGIGSPLPPNTLSLLSSLQTLNLASNSIPGGFPTDLVSIKNLSHLYLQINNFSGPIVSDLSGWINLKTLDISSNAFNGIIPSSIAKLTALHLLNLSHNAFSGKFPDLNLPNLVELSLSNNHLNGEIPKSLRKFPNSSFAGNNYKMQLTGLSSSIHAPVPSPSLKYRRTRKFGESIVIGIAIGAPVFMLLLLALIFIAVCSKKKSGESISQKQQNKHHSPEKMLTESQSKNKLVFFEDCPYAFDLEDLLRASAEVLGKGSFGTAYKAILEDSSTVVVKRLKEVSAGKREFEQQMEVVGRIRHDNVVNLRAYYYSKDEKLMVYDYYPDGSLSSILHGKRGNQRQPLDWVSRLKAALGTARGMARIHMENSGRFVHGNLKSSNIFLNSQGYGCVSDVGIPPLTSYTFLYVGGYRAPEIMDARKASQASDTYNLGVVILELLTGKSAMQVGRGDESVHLVRWVHSILREEWTAEVFDVQLMRYPNIEEELVEMLQIAMSCVAGAPEQRPKLVDVVRQIEDIVTDSTAHRSSSGADDKLE